MPMEKAFKIAALASLILVLGNFSAFSVQGGDSVTQSVSDGPLVTFSDKAHIKNLQIYPCPAGWTCNTLLLSAPFNCRKNCKKLFPDLSGIPVGFVSPGGQCPAILHGGEIAGTIFEVTDGVGWTLSLPHSETVEERMSVFPVPGVSMLGSAVLDIRKKSGLLAITDEDFQVSASPVSVFISNIACTDITPEVILGEPTPSSTPTP
jgi:hypothetical protein